MIEYLASINKISILAFIVTLGFLIWEFQQMKKAKLKGTKPVIPQFDQSATPVPIETQQIQVDTGADKRSQYHKILFPALIVMVVIFGIMSVLSLFTSKQAPSGPQQAQVVVQQVKSAGIKVYTADWKELTGDTVTTVGPGDTIILGVSSIKGTSIDKARIRVNSNQWSVETITDKYDTAHNVYYRQFQIATGEPKLQIEAQLHSQADGWLSE